MGIEAPQVPILGSSSERNHAVSFAGQLDDGESLTGTPSVTEISTSDLTITNVAVNTSAVTINGVSVAIGAAVQFKATGMQAGATYRLKVSCATDATPAQTLTGVVSFRARDDSS